jgi:hypothetical protein
MNGRVLRAVVLVAVLMALASAVLFPQRFISPGELLEQHKAFGSNCFACHAPFQGSSANRCLDCHAIDRIGLFTTKGQPISKPKSIISFHQKLADSNCLACHTDHQGSMAQMIVFSHELLRQDMRKQCDSCHAKPSDDMHAVVGGECQQCHSTKGWRPAAFDHAKYFALDRDHNVACTTCHANNSFRSYTCYGCHEHTLENIRAEHWEEGIRDFENCVECHRSANEPDEGNDD